MPAPIQLVGCMRMLDRMPRQESKRRGDNDASVRFQEVFGMLLLSERLGWAGWAGCVVMLCGIVLAEPAAASALRRFVPARV